MEEPTFIGTMAWATAVCLLFIPPLIVMLILKAAHPMMEYRRSVSFFFGWIPGNLIAVGYLWYTHLGIIDAFFVLFFIEIVQVSFIMIMARAFIKMCGEVAFDPKT